MTLFFVGSYTEVLGHVPNGCGEGIYAYDLNDETGTLTRKTVVGNINNPSYVHFNAATSELYAIEEVEGNDPEAHLISYRVDHNSSDNEKVTVTETSRVNTKASALCHICTTSDNHHVLLAAYGSGSVTCFDKTTGNLTSLKYSGNGPNQQRQESPHIHQTVQSPDGKFLYVCDLGCDTIWSHSVTSLPNIKVESSIQVPPGYGPRHMVFHPTLPNLMYVLCELSGMLLSYSQDDSGTWKLNEEVNSLPKEFDEDKGTKASAAIRIHPSGKALFVSNRLLQDSIAMFPLDDCGKLLAKSAQWTECRGKTPRDFALKGKWLLVANQDEDTMTVFEIYDENNAMDLKYTEIYPCKTPTCIAFSES